MAANKQIPNINQAWNRTPIMGKQSSVYMCGKGKALWPQHSKEHIHFEAPP